MSNDNDAEDGGADDGPLGHQLHWFALFEEPKRAVAHLDAALDRVGLVAGSDPEFPPFFLIATDDATMVHILFVATRDGAGDDVVIDRYPLLRCGPPVEVTGIGAEPDEQGASALVTVAWDAALRLTCFNPLHFREGSRLLAGETCPMGFAGLAIRAEVMDPEHLRAAGLADDIAALIPAHVAHPENESRPDWYAFYAYVTAVEEVILAEVPLYRLDVVLARGDSGDLPATLVVGRHVAPEGFSPRPGDVLGGVLWLTGLRIDV